MMTLFNDRRSVIDKRKPCPTCKGHGRFADPPIPHPDFPFAQIIKTKACTNCGGTGLK